MGFFPNCDVELMVRDPCISVFPVVLHGVISHRIAMLSLIGHSIFTPSSLLPLISHDILIPLSLLFYINSIVSPINNIVSPLLHNE
jgi:hypothetical protein